MKNKTDKRKGTMKEADSRRGADSHRGTEKPRKDSARGDKRPKNIRGIERQVKTFFSMMSGAKKQGARAKDMSDIHGHIDMKLAQKLDSAGHREIAQEMADISENKPSLLDILRVKIGSRSRSQNLAILGSAGFGSILLFGLIAFALVYYRGTNVPILRNLTEQAPPVLSMHKKYESVYGVSVNGNSFTISTPQDQPFRSLGLSNKVEIIPDVPHDVQISEDNTRITVVPTGDLDEETQYTVKIKEGTMFSNGTSLAQDFSWTFRTEPEFVVTGITPRDGSSTAPVDTTIEVEFTYKDLDVEAFGDYFEITPPVEGKLELHGKKIVFVPGENFASGSVYNVLVKSGYSNVRGDSLPADYESTFKVGYYASDDKYVTDTNMSWSESDPVLATSQEPWIGVYTSGLEGNITYTLYETTPEGVADVMKDYTWQIYRKPADQYVTKIRDFSVSIDDSWFFNISLDDYGIYFVEATHPSHSYPLYKFFVYSPLGMITSSSLDADMVWVNDMNEKEPVSGSDVSFYDFDTAEIPVHSATTNEYGYGYKDEGGSEMMVVEYLGNYAITLGGSLASTSSWWLGGWHDSSRDNENRAFIYFDRPLYRPGDTVRYKVIVRKEDDMSYTVPEGQEVTVRLGSSAYMWSGLRELPLYEETLPLSNDFGTAVSEFQLPSNTDPGYKTMEVIVDGEVSGSGVISIAEFQKPRHTFDLTLDKVLSYSGDTVTVDVYGADYSGDPAGGVQVGLRVSRGEIKNAHWFESANELDREQLSYVASSEVVDTTLTLDASGHASYQFTTDVSGYASKIGIYSVYLWSAEEYLTLNSDYVMVSHADVGLFAQPVKSYINEGADNDVVMRTVGLWDFSSEGGVRVEYDVEREWREWVEDGEYYDPVTKTRRPTYSSVSHTETVLEGEEVVTDDNGLGTVELSDLAYGSYTIRATYFAGKSITRVIEDLFYVYESPEESADIYSDWNSAVQKFVIYTDKDAYSVGENAAVTIKTTLEGKGLYMVKRGETYDWKVVDFSDGVVELTEKMTDVMSPSVDMCVWGIDEYVSHDSPYGDVTQQYLTNMYESSCRVVQVERDYGRLEIDVDADKDEYGPGDDVTLDIKVRDQAGKGVYAEVSVDVVDRALLDIVRGNNMYEYDIYESFYERVRQRAQQQVSPTRYNYSAGGGYGGGGDGSAPRSNFSDIAHWNGVVKTDVAGRAEVTFTLPDDLTTWAVKVVGITQDTSVGEGSTEFFARKDIRLDANLPRYLRSDDSWEMSLEAHNYSGEPVAGLIEVTCEGCKEDLYTEELAVPDGTRRSVAVPVQPAEGVSEVTVTANFNSTTSVYDSVQWSIPVIGDGFMTNETQSLLLKEGDGEGSFNFTIPSGVEVSQADLELNVARSFIGEGALVPVDAGIASSIQLSSSIIHNSLFLKYYNEINPQDSRSTYEQKITSALDLLAPNQSENGGFGWFDYDTINYEVSSYVGLAYGLASEVGIDIEGGRKSNLTRYLRDGLNSNQTSPDEKVLAIYALSVMGDSTVLPYALAFKNDTIDIADSPLAIANLMLALQQLGSEGDAAELIPIITSSARYSDRSVTWSEADVEFRVLHSQAYVTAKVYQALSFYEGLEIADLARTWLVENPISVTGDAVDAVAIFYALAVSNIDNLEGRLDANDVIVTVNGTKVREFEVKGGDGSSGLVALTIDAGMLKTGENVVEVERVGDGELYIVGNLTYSGSSGAGMDEFDVSRSIHDFETGAPVSSVNKGDIVTIRTKVTVDRDGYNMITRDFIPAGFEPVQYNLGSYDYQFYKKWWQWGQNDGVRRYGTITLDHIAFTTYSIEDEEVYEFEYPAVAAFSGVFSGSGSQAYLEGFGDIGGSVESDSITVR